jgi:hypothetical protein
MKQNWIDSIAAANAPSVGFFLLAMVAVIALAGWLEWRRL